MPNIGVTGHSTNAPRRRSPTTAARHGAVAWEYGGFCYFEVLRGPDFWGVKLRWAQRGSQIIVAQVPVSLPPPCCHQASTSTPVSSEWRARRTRSGVGQGPLERARGGRRGE